MRKKYIGIWSIILALVLVSVPFGVWKAMADTEPAYQIKILEVVDNGTFALQTALKNTTNVTVDTMRMKTFVAMREELNGKYDAIYFGNGTYSSKQPSTFSSGPSNEQRKAHDTTDIMNDITKLKSSEVENYYILKGLPVIFNTSIANQSPKSNLYTLYNKYASAATRASNTIFVSDSQLSTVVDTIKNADALYKQRPRVEITAKPQDFLTTSKIYTTGDTLTFTFNANNVKDFSTPVNAKLYASVDKVLALSDENVVASSTLSSRAGTLTYKLPQTFSGPVYWKLELTANGQSDYAEGAFRVRDKQTVIRVLQVMPSNDASSLLNAANMTQSYLKTSDYDIQITPILFSAFNTASNVNSYANLNGKYDMIIFGFVDNYNSQTSGSLTDAAAAGVNAFIKTGQAVMFTHDTMIGDKTNPWIKNFQTTTGQTGLYTNMGYGAPNPSTRTKVVNTGMLTQFPFDLSVKPGNTNGYVGQIALTHDQYYMLDLEDPTIVPWYNIISETTDNTSYKRDSDDSYDHYYTYSKGNVTYSGTGHTNTKFPEWEQKLFVNTMFRAFIGSNHAPSVTVISPTSTETTKPSYLKDLVFSYQVDDLDLNDLNVYSSVKFKVNGEYVSSMAIAEKNVPKGTVITEKFTNPLLLKEGTIQIEITARDKQGATAVKTIDLTMQKVSANLLTERTLDTIPANYEFLTGSTVGMTYKVTPQSIPAADIRSGENGLKTLEISNVVYTEKLPAGLEISGVLPTGMTKTGTLSAGYTLSKTFDKITYTLSGSSYVPNTGSAFSFHLDTVPTSKGTYNLNQARLAYEDVHATADSSTAGSSAITLMNGYSLITLGSDATTITGGSINGRALFNGPVSLSNFSIGGGLSAYDASFPTVSTNGDLTISGGSINKGPILSGDAFTSSNFGISDTTIMATGNIKLNGNNGLSNSSVWAGGNLTMDNYYVNSGLNFYTVGNFALTGNSGMNGGSVTYGGTSSYTSQYVKSATPASIKSQYDTQKSTTNAKGVSDFAAAKQQLVSLSNSYAALTANGARDTADTSGIVFKGTDAKMNVFKVDGTQLSNLTNLKIQAPAGSTAVLNVVGGNVTFSGGFDLTGVTADKVIVNYIGTGSVTLTSIGLKGTLLAPQATVNFNGGDIYGTIVAGMYKTTGWTSIGNGAFGGSSPSSATVTPGETRTIQFPDVYFNAIVKTKSIALADQALWVGDSTVIVPNVLMTDGTTDLTPLLTWTSSDPSVASIAYPLGTTNGKSASVSVSGLKAGTAVITAVASDGSGVKGTATVTVEAPALSIDGSSSVNVGQTIKDIKAVVNASNLRIDNVVWTIVSTSTDNVKLNPQTDPTSLFVTGSKSGTVTVKATATITNTRTNTVRTLTATKDIKIVDSLSSVVVNGPDTVKKGGSINLSTVILPEAANIGSISWTVTDGQGNAVVTPGSPAPAKTATLQGVAPGPVTVSVTVRTAGDNPIERTVTKTIWVLDFNMTGPDTLYVGDSINFTSSLLPANYSGTKGAVNWTVSNVSGTGTGTANYATLGTPSVNGNTGSVSLTGSTPGQVKVTATITTPAGDFTVDRIVTIKPVVTALLLPPTVKVQNGVPFDLIAGAPLRVNPISIPVSDIQSQLVWTSADPSGVSVNPNGVVTGLKEGSEVVVTVTYQRTPTSPAITATTKIIVAKAADPNAPTDGDRY
ncbi:DUF5057 domain-containing protein [Saccharibacillus sacchari]|uniref:DUF5057 domain-containing protein n=1 Tax=Saccharibacillus sacchari TaxID=456493 RepID=A0ACC6P9N3_9BACL